MLLILYLYESQVMQPSGMIFNQLVHLELNTYAKGWWDLLTHMLQDSPKLQTLKLISVCGPIILFIRFSFPILVTDNGVVGCWS